MMNGTQTQRTPRLVKKTDLTANVETPVVSVNPVETVSNWVAEYRDKRANTNSRQEFTKLFK